MATWTSEDKFSIKLIDNAGAPVANVILKIELYAAAKNNFYIVLPPTGNEGLVSMRLAFFKESIDADRRFFLMDYADSFETISGKACLHLMSKDNLDRAIKAYHDFKDYTSYPDGYETWLRNCRNHLFEPLSLHTDIPAMMKGLVVTCKLADTTPKS